MGEAQVPFPLLLVPDVVHPSRCTDCAPIVCFHRTVCNPAFGELNNALVGETTIQVGHEMMDKWNRDAVVTADGNK